MADFALHDAVSEPVDDDAFRSRYYDSQAALRGINTVADVQKIRMTHAPEYDRLLSLYPLGATGKRVVELASGPGIMLGYLADKGHTPLEGVEFSDKYVSLSQQQNLPVTKADVRDWFKAQAPGSIGAVFAVDFVEHLGRNDVVLLFDSVSRVLAPGGLFFFRVPCGDSPFSGLNFLNDITHETIFTTVATRALLQMSGMTAKGFVDDFDLVRHSYTGQRAFLAKAARIILRKMILWGTGQLVYTLSPTMWVIAVQARP